MGEKHPKRRKDKYNPYTISQSGKYFFLSFNDGQGKLHKFEVNEELYNLLNRFELDDLSFLNEVDRHYEHSELTDASLNSRAFYKPETIEDTVVKNVKNEKLHKAISELPEVQKHRVLLYFFEELAYEQIAEMEGCKYQAVQSSIYTALKTLKTFLK